MMLKISYAQKDIHSLDKYVIFNLKKILKLKNNIIFKISISQEVNFISVGLYLKKQTNKQIFYFWGFANSH